MHYFAPQIRIPYLPRRESVYVLSIIVVVAAADILHIHRPLETRFSPPASLPPLFLEYFPELPVDPSNVFLLHTILGRRDEGGAGLCEGEKQARNLAPDASGRDVHGEVVSSPVVRPRADLGRPRLQSGVTELDPRTEVDCGPRKLRGDEHGAIEAGTTKAGLRLGWDGGCRSALGPGQARFPGMDESALERQQRGHLRAYECCVHIIFFI